MKVSILSIGNEILSGLIENTNASYIASSLYKSGFSVSKIITVADLEETIVTSIKEAIAEFDIIITTGGLGPTSDDVTGKALLQITESKLVFNEEVYNDIQSLFEKRGMEPGEINKAQAYVPEGAEIIPNKQGTAPGLWIEKSNTTIIALPGVPFEMKAILDGFILPKLINKYEPPRIYVRSILTHGIPESFLAEKLKQWELNLDKAINLSYLPSPGQIRIQLSGSSKDHEAIQHKIENSIITLRKIIPDNIFRFDEDKIETVIGKLLKRNGKTLSIAESCTGGYISHRITTVPGSSEYYKGAVVAYSNAVKKNLLDVSAKTLEKHGAVSKATIRQMHQNCLRVLNTDYAIAISGIAGPGGGTPEKPVGTIWIMAGSLENNKIEILQSGNDRMVNIEKSFFISMGLLRMVLLEECKNNSHS